LFAQAFAQFPSLSELLHCSRSGKGEGASVGGAGRKVGQLHRQCGMKFELLGMLNKFCGQLSATKNEAAKYLLNQLNMYPKRPPLPLTPCHAPSSAPLQPSVTV